MLINDEIESIIRFMDPSTIDSNAELIRVNPLLNGINCIKFYSVKCSKNIVQRNKLFLYIFLALVLDILSKLFLEVLESRLNKQWFSIGRQMKFIPSLYR